MTNHYSLGRKMRSRVTQHKQYMEIGRWKIHLRAINIYLLHILLRQSLQARLYNAIRTMCVNIEEVIMVFHHYTINIKYCMMMFILIY